MEWTISKFSEHIQDPILVTQEKSLEQYPTALKLLRLRLKEWLKDQTFQVLWQKLKETLVPFDHRVRNTPIHTRV